MSVQKCGRCGAEEYIPTHQYVKFGLEITGRHELCATCWEDLRHFALYPQVSFPIAYGAVHCQRCHKLPSKNQFFPVAFDNLDRIYCLNCYAEIRAWHKTNPNA